MSEPVRRTGRTCEVRVHEQIRRNTRTRGAGASWIAGDEAGRRPAANVSVVSGYRTRTASPSKRHKTSCRRPGRAVMFEGLSPKRWSGEGCAAVTAAIAPPGPRPVIVPKESARAVRQGFAGRSGEAPAGSGRSLGNPPSIAHRRASAHPTQTSSADSSALIAMEKTHKQRPDTARRNMPDRPAMQSAWHALPLRAGQNWRYSRRFGPDNRKSDGALCGLNARVYDHPGVQAA